jgi:cysteine protease ATG4
MAMARATSANGHVSSVPTRNGQQENRVKNKILSAWNNVKYGNLWSQLDIKPTFSKNSPVWMLGEAYHRKLAVDIEPSPATPMGNQVRTFRETQSDAGIEAFELDFSSRIWLTYRKEFEEFRGTKMNTDCGWGCMIRSGQMLLAQGIVTHWLGRKWRWINSQTGILSAHHWKTERLHRAIVQLFSDSPDRVKCPLSIHTLVALGRSAGKQPGEWFGPSSVSHLLALAVKQTPSGHGLLDDLTVYVSQDCTVYKQDILDLCTSPASSCSGCGEKSTTSLCSECDKQSILEDFSIIDIKKELPEQPEKYSQDVVIDGESWCMEQETSQVPSVEVATPAERWRAVIILVPVRLGGESFNGIYTSCVKTLLTHHSCIGIIGGRPRHSLYFVGFQDDNLINLDPHRLQDKVETDRHNFTLDSFHCTTPRKMSINRMDPSCCIGFYLRTRTEFDNWCASITSLATPATGSTKIDYPIFSISEGRGRENDDWVKLSDDQREFSKDSLRETESEEFVFL